MQPLSSLNLLTYIFLLTLLLSTIATASTNEHNNNQIISNFSATETEKNAGAVVVSRNISMVIENADQHIIDYHILVAILSDKAARDYGKISIAYNSYFNEIELLSAHSIDKKGIKTAVSQDAIQLKNNTSSQTYNDSRELAFALPRLTNGSFLEYNYRIKVKTAPLPGYWDKTFYFNEYQLTGNAFRVDPVREASITISAAKNHQFEYKLENIQAKFKKETIDSKIRYSWTAKNLSEIVYENNMPSLKEKWAFLRASSIPNWSTIDNWATETYSPKIIADTSIKTAAISITKDKYTNTEKIRALFYYMLENIHYISADVRRGGLIPHTATETWTNKYGDCKDQATLFTSMLRSIGIEAYPALIGVYPRIDVSPEIPSLGFSHMIVYIPNVDGGLWVDTSSDWGTFPGIIWELENRHAFILDGKGGNLVKIERNKNKVNEFNFSNKFKFKGYNLSSNITIKIKGDSGDRYKQFTKTSPDAESEIKSIIKKMYTRAENIDVRIIDNATQDSPFKIIADLDFGDISDEAKEQFNYSGGIVGLLNLFTTISEPPDPDNRKNDVLIGPNFTLNYNIEYAAPKSSYKPSIINSSYSETTPFYTYTHQVKDSLDMVTAVSRFQLKQEVISAEDYPDYYEKINALANDGQWLVSFKNDINYEKEKKLERLAEENNDSDSKLKLAKHKISSGNYDEAMHIAEEIISHERNNGEAHYLLGLIHGYKNNFDKSQDHFNQAEKHGYVP